MEIKIFQIIADKDKNLISFQRYDTTIQLQGSIKSEIYGQVYEGEVDAENLERIYELFNWFDPGFKRPEGFYGHSLSVSDVVAVKDQKTNAWSYHYCDWIGFVEIPFEEDFAERMF